MVLPLCNKLPERAPRLGSFTFFLCWRCTGVLVGFVLLLVTALYLNASEQNCMSFSLFCIPALFDVYRQDFLHHEGNNILRFTTGMLLGMSTFGISAIVINGIKLLN